MKPEPNTQSDEDYPYPKDAFIEADDDRFDRLLAAIEEKPRGIHFSQISLEKRISSQLQDLFVPKCITKLTREIVLRYSPIIMDTLSEPQILSHK